MLSSKLFSGKNDQSKNQTNSSNKATSLDTAWVTEVNTRGSTSSVASFHISPEGTPTKKNITNVLLEENVSLQEESQVHSNKSSMFSFDFRRTGASTAGVSSDSSSNLEIPTPLDAKRDGDIKSSLTTWTSSDSVTVKKLSSVSPSNSPLPSSPSLTSVAPAVPSITSISKLSSIVPTVPKLSNIKMKSFNLLSRKDRTTSGDVSNAVAPDDKDEVSEFVEYATDVVWEGFDYVGDNINDTIEDMEEIITSATTNFREKYRRAYRNVKESLAPSSVSSRRKLTTKETNRLYISAHLNEICYIGKSNNMHDNLNQMKNYAKNEGVEVRKIEMIEEDSVRVITMEAKVPNDVTDEMEWTYVICWRGSASLQDFLLNAMSMVQVEFKSSNQEYIGEAGYGFLEAYNSIRNRKDAHLVMKAIESAEHLKGGLLVLGHSLGGALANLTAADVFMTAKARTSQGLSPNKVRVVTFGCPRTFDQSTVEKINAFGYQTARCINECDPIPTLPFRLAIVESYSHIGDPLYFDETARIWHAYDYSEFDGIGDGDGVSVRIDRHYLKGSDGYIARLKEACT